MNDLASILAANRAGSTVGAPCFCTSNDHVLRAILAHSARTGLPAIVEATCNQVNQEGGYTGMKPKDFVTWLTRMADKAGVPADRLVLGGDHLGPNPWRGEPESVAMAKARDLVRLYVEAGFRKIHLDTSMPLGGEAPPDFATIAARAADLCHIAEDYAPDQSQLVYVIGTEVPIPGGETEEPDALDVTSPTRFADTIETHRAAFAARGLDAAWDRIAGVVVQPGVDFGHSSVYRFDPDAADPLVAALRDHPDLCFEAHSTDYQPDAALRSLVERHFAFLKVGPELTFRFREAVFALARIETLLAPPTPSRLREVLAVRMDENDRHWRDHYKGPEDDLSLLRSYSYSDRIRYYWTDPAVAEALGTLLDNLRGVTIPETLVSQGFGALDFGDIPRGPDALIERHVLKCVSRYYRAAGME